MANYKVIMSALCFMSGSNAYADDNSVSLLCKVSEAGTAVEIIGSNGTKKPYICDVSCDYNEIDGNSEKKCDVEKLTIKENTAAAVLKSCDVTSGKEIEITSRMVTCNE